MTETVAKTDLDALTARVVSTIAALQKKPPESIGLDARFEELGIDSLSAFDLLCQLEDELGVVIPDDDARQMKTVRDVIDRVSPLLEQAA
jgi:acyl carrier protein